MTQPEQCTMKTTQWRNQQQLRKIIDSRDNAMMDRLIILTVVHLLAIMIIPVVQGGIIKDNKNNLVIAKK